MNVTAQEKLMYGVMKAVYDSGIPVSFKGSMVLKACLAEAGYDEVMPKGETLSCQHCYVGIKPDEGEWGLTVWSNLGEDDDEYWATVSSYVNQQYKLWTIDPRLYTWVLIR